MNPVEKLTEYFLTFPGIGPRQAKRFVYFLLTKDTRFREDISRMILRLIDEMKKCSSCHRFFALYNSSSKQESYLCEICADKNTDHKTLLIVEKEADFESIRRTGAYEGRYFILGGNIPILEENPSQKIRARELFHEIEKRAGENDNQLKEIILAMGATTEGDNTLLYLKKTLEPLVKKYSLTLSVLGRGLSTGTELEYSDTDTFTNALKNRR